ncbi:MAG: hypothetical protein PWQ57_2000 [Desulfovibrionales bacterium]|nr:hypothetical protein [Desulfovibrionales bacterium]
MRVPNEAIVAALLADQRFGFKDGGAFLTGGICPQCGKRELFVPKARPWYLTCNRKNKCGFVGAVKDELPELFAGYLERFPPTKEEPERTADAYLALDRGFDLSRIKGWYTQEAARSGNGFCPTVRFYLDEAHTRYWERLIGKTKSDGGRKANFGGKRKADGTLYRGDAWTPPDMEPNKGERCYIVEGVFHAIALHHTGRKAAAALSCGNFPEHFIERRKGEGVVWTLALDADPAGREAMRKHEARLRAMGEKVDVCLLPEGGMDWDDLWRAGRLTDAFIEERLYHGRLFSAKTVNEKAYHHFARNKLAKFVLDFDNALYSVEVQTSQLGKDLEEQAVDLDSPQGLSAFLARCDVDSIANCRPRFLYVERDDILETQSYVFRVSYRNGSPSELVTLEGSNIDSPTSLNKALLNKTHGGTFDGTPPQMKILRDRWFSHHMKVVASAPFVGYDRAAKAWVFQEHAVSGGRVIPLNEQGHFTVGRRGIKTSLAGVHINTEGEFSPVWLERYVQAFDMPGLALLSFWLGALFVQQIRDLHKSFPFLEFTGEPGAGKSTCLEFLWKCIGRDDYEGFDIMKSSYAGRRRAFSQLSNMPVVLIESDRDNGERNAKIRQFNFDECKPFYNGRGTGTLGVAKRGNDTEENLFQAALVISQNAEVDGSEALLQRIVHCHMDKSHHRPGTREIARWFERQTSATVGGFLLRALVNERKILDAYARAFTDIEARFGAPESGLKNARVVKNHAQIAACGQALGVLFPAMRGRLAQRLTDYLYDRALAREQRLSADHPLLEQFWETFEYLNAQAPSRKEGWLNHSSDPERIAFNLNQFRECCYADGQELPDLKQLKKLLPQSKRYLFETANKCVWSRHTEKNIKCWVFLRA